MVEIVKGFHKVQREERLQKFLTGLSGVEILTLDLNSAELAGRISPIWNEPDSLSAVPIR